jgi:murein DD-endopeptidase MepM/ murein hydrolase activator NlpD
VLHFAGANADASEIAYTSLAKVDVKGSGVPRPVGLDDALQITLDDLVPTGRLVVEHADGRTRVISSENAFVTSAAWHPSDANIIAYGYSEGDQYAIAIHDLSTGQDRDLVRGALTPDYVVWSDDGRAVGAYMDDASLPAAQAAGEHAGEPLRRWQSFDALQTERIGPATFLNGKAVFAFDGPALTLALETAAVLKLHDALGDQQAVLERSQNGHLVSETFRADQVRYLSSKGLALVNFDAKSNSLWATDRVLPPQQIGIASAVSYHIPYTIWGKPVSFTQVGSGYGGGCLFSGGGAGDHVGTMAYAIDMQIQSPYNGDEVIASANGTVSSWNASTNCNYGDADCSLPDCASSNWGNYIIISHADGKWTMYAHLEVGSNFKVTHTGAISTPCWMVDEGGTGTSSGNKNTCGDHLHFQWQNGSTTGSQSVAGTFVDAPTLGSGSCIAQNPTSGIMSCSL